MNVGVMKDYKLRDLRASHTLGWLVVVQVVGCSARTFRFFFLANG
jgi:hypothetical protein